MKVCELLDDEKKWMKHDFAADKKGHSVQPESKRACRWCLAGAIFMCYPYSANEIVARVIKRIGHGSSISSWNDDSWRRFSDVRELIDELDI